MIRVIVFDFDGTLVQSNEIKGQAFYSVFGDVDDEIISCVLAKINTKSRYEIIYEILKFSKANKEIAVVNMLANNYGSYVYEDVKKCPEVSGASKLLSEASHRYILYLSSLTPKSDLMKIVEHRGWSSYFKEIFGYPSNKVETLRQILTAEKCRPDQLVVIGDGASDKISATSVSSNFIMISKPHDLGEILLELIANNIPAIVK